MFSKEYFSFFMIAKISKALRVKCYVYNLSNSFADKYSSVSKTTNKPILIFN